MKAKPGSSEARFAYEGLGPGDSRACASQRAHLIDQ